MPGGLTARKQEDIEMGRRGGHRHVALVAAEHDAATILPQADAASGFSLLRLSVPARLAMAAIGAALLWGAVLWALA
jgi:hypothetical protein